MDEGVWIASPAGTPLAEAKHVYWFESAFDAMAYYQLHRDRNRELDKAVFVSTSNFPSTKQMRGVLEQTIPARQHICFNSSTAWHDSAWKLEREIYCTVRDAIEQTPERKPYLEARTVRYIACIRFRVKSMPARSVSKQICCSAGRVTASTPRICVAVGLPPVDTKTALRSSLFCA